MAISKTFSDQNLKEILDFLIDKKEKIFIEVNTTTLNTISFTGSGIPFKVWDEEYRIGSVTLKGDILRRRTSWEEHMDLSLTLFINYENIDIKIC